MSNSIYGYLQPALKKEELASLKKYVESSPLNIRTITKQELFNYPNGYIPEDGDFIFDIADGPNSVNATYLIDYCEYDPETSDIGFPPDPKERLDILVDTLLDMIKITNSKKMIVALNESEQIGTIKKIKLSELYAVIHADFEEYQGPPDTLYEIIV